MTSKPAKQIYPNQRDVHDAVLGFVRSELESVACEAYLVGSVTRSEFGKYAEKYGPHEGSDIDLVVFMKKNEIPKEWSYLNTERGWWRLYRLGQTVLNGTVHIVEAMVVKEGSELVAYQRMKELGWTPERVK